MKITFSNRNNPAEIISELEETLSHRKLGQIISFDLSDSSDLTVYLKKLGTSELQFDWSEMDSGFEWVLAKEKIAFSHKAFKDDILGKLHHLVEDLGGSVES